MTYHPVIKNGMDSVGFSLLRVIGSPFKRGPVYLISRALAAREVVGGDYLSASASRMGSKLCLTR